MATQFTEVLDTFKREERPEVVLLIAGDSAAARLMVAWSNARVRPRRSGFPLRGRDRTILWKCLWHNVSYSLAELALRAGMSARGTRAKMAELIGNRIIYPDGTLNQFAQRFLRKTVLELFDLKPAAKRRADAVQTTALAER